MPYSAIPGSTDSNTLDGGVYSPIPNDPAVLIAANIAASAAAAAASAAAAAASYDSFDDRYLGSKVADPTLDNDGNALLIGALYWNSVAGQMCVYSGAVWVQAFLPGSTYVLKSGDTMTGALLGVLGAVATPGFAFAGDANNGWWSPGADQQAWSTAGTQRLSINATGNWLLAAPSSGIALNLTGLSGQTALNINTAGASVNAIVINSAAAAQAAFALAQAGQQAMSFYNPASTDELRFFIGGADRVRWLGTGGAIINTPSSGIALQVNALSAGMAQVWSDGARSAFLLFDANTANFGTGTAHALSLQTNSAERVRVTNAGNISIALPSSSFTFTAALRTDLATGFSWTSANKGLRINLANAGFSAIEGMDGTGGLSIQPLAINGSTLSLQVSTVEAIGISAARNVSVAVPSSGDTLTVNDVRGIIGCSSTANGPSWRVKASATYNATFGLFENTITNGWWFQKNIGASGALSIGYGSAEGVGSTVLSAAQTGTVTINAPALGAALVINGQAYTPTSSQAFTATPTFNAALSNVFEFSGAMTANVTSCTITNPVAGQTITIRVKQDATGSRTFATPTGAKITGSVQSTLSTASLLTLTYSAMDTRWEGSWLGLPV